MVWAGVGYFGKTEIIFTSSKMNSIDYINIINDNLLPVAQSISTQKWVLQQDNASVHRSNMTKKWFEQQKVRVLESPVNSPDLNVIENLWGLLVKNIYHNGRQFDNFNDLKEAIKANWNTINQEYIQNLFASIPKRLTECVNNKGGVIDY